MTGSDSFYCIRGVFPNTFRTNMKRDDRVYRLYRTCRDGSLATVVRRRALRPSSPSHMVLSQPKLASLDCAESAQASRADSREMNFLYPYQTFTSMIGNSKRKSKTRLVSPKAFSPTLSLQSRHEDIGGRMDLLGRSRNQALPPLLVKPDFQVQPYSMSPILASSPQVKVRRRPANFSEAEEGLKALGFEGDWEKRERLRKFEKVKSTSPKGEVLPREREVHEQQVIMRQHERPRLTPSEVMREEASQYLQEEFRQRLTSGYLRKLHPTGSGLGLLGFRGLELV